MRTSSLAALAALLSLGACGGGPSAPDPLDSSLTGQWRVAGDTSLIVEVGVAPPGLDVLRGCIAVGFDPIARPLDRVRVEMVGVFARRSVWLSPVGDQRQLWVFSGVRLAADTLIGMGTLEGRGSAPVRLVRVAVDPGC